MINREQQFVWVRNSNGFAFQFYYSGMDAKKWNNIRLGAIGALDEDRGWSRYLDPPIDLYIVPSSEDVDATMHISIIQAMNELDMHEGMLNIDAKVTLAEKDALAKLRKKADRTPDCATTKVHLVRRQNIGDRSLIQVSRVSHQS